MTETIVKLSIDESIVNLKRLLNEKDAHLIKEESDSVTVRHGSIWGVSPVSAKKIVRFELSTHGEDETKIASQSKLSRDYVRFTLFGIILTVAVMLVCLWISFDLSAVVLEHSNFLGGVVSSSVRAFRLLSDVILLFALFLAATLVLESVVIININRKIETFARRILMNIGK